MYSGVLLIRIFFVDIISSFWKHLSIPSKNSAAVEITFALAVKDAVLVFVEKTDLLLTTMNVGVLSQVGEQGSCPSFLDTGKQMPLEHSDLPATKFVLNTLRIDTFCSPHNMDRFYGQWSQQWR
jgi:hypothetical protein